eukprot:gene7840-17354_t
MVALPSVHLLSNGNGTDTTRIKATEDTVRRCAFE